MKKIAVVFGDEMVIAVIPEPIHETMLVVGGSELGGFGKASDVFKTIDRMATICKGMTMMEALAVMSTAPLLRQRLNDNAQVTFNDSAIRKSFEPHAV